MGVTIHYEGKLKSANDFNDVIEIIQEFSEFNNMSYSVFEESKKLLKRVKDEQEWDYVSSVKGIRLQPHENTDPLIFEFDENYYIQDYCKTQFSDIDIHIKIISVLRKIAPHFEDLIVIDEGEYWDTSDKEYLQQLIDDCFDKINEVKSQNINMEGPFRIKSGRIIDLMEN